MAMALNPLIMCVCCDRDNGLSALSVFVIGWACQLSFEIISVGPVSFPPYIIETIYATPFADNNAI